MTTNETSRAIHSRFPILVPLDGSELAARALPVAEQLAKQFGSALELVQVLPFAVLPYAVSGSYIPGDIYQQAADEQERSAREDLERAATTAREHGVSEVHIHVDRANTAAMLIELSERLHVGLIVMTTHGRTGLSRFALGSVADRVVRGGRVPVLLLRSFASAQPDTDLRRALVPLDGSSLAEKALDLIVELAGPVVQEITLLRAVDPRDGSEGLRQAESYLESVRNRLMERLAGHDCYVICLAHLGSPAECIVDSAEAKNSLVVMATHGEAGIGRWTIGTTADRVLRDGHTSLVLVHPARD